MLHEFIKISHYAGMREDIVQAGGGNSSAKLSPDRMLIKASGYQLTDIREDQGYAIVNPATIGTFFQEHYKDELSDAEEKRLLEDALIDGKRPSIETFLHSVTDVLTLHTHPIVVNILAMRKNGMQILKELIPDALIVGYATPGIKLAQKYFSALYQEGVQNNYQVIFLQNHGMIVTGKTADEVIAKNEEVLVKIEAYLKLDMQMQRRVTSLWNAFCAEQQEGIVWRVTDSNVLLAFQKFSGVWHHEFCPDCLVYCGKRMLFIADDEVLEQAIEQHTRKYGPAVVIMWKGSVYIHAVNVKKALEIQSVLSFSAQVVMNNEGEMCAFLPEEEQNFLLHWDAEKYRQTL